MGQGTVVNTWALKNYRVLTRETVVAIFSELQAHIAGAKVPYVLSNASDALALATRFKGVLYRYPYFKRKHLRVLHAVIDRCGEAYSSKDVSKLYIGKATVEEWITSFAIPPEKIGEYLRPLQIFGVLQQSSDPNYLYRVSDDFYRLMGPVAQHLVVPVDTRRFAEMMAVANGVASVYVIATALRRQPQEEQSVIPWFLKLPMIYTLSGLEPGAMRIRDTLEIPRINAVDNYFVINRGAPVEWWRSIRTEAFEFMADNYIIEQAVPNGYKLSKLWVRTHEEGVKRYVQRVRERIERRYRGF
uniref:Uncharacterized protein n=1 Tax=Ignisphaera aggregans TaxID=334771 RepID=A0A7J3Z571_9CREN